MEAIIICRVLNRARYQKWVWFECSGLNRTKILNPRSRFSLRLHQHRFAVKWTFTTTVYRDSHFNRAVCNLEMSHWMQLVEHHHRRTTIRAAQPPSTTMPIRNNEMSHSVNKQTIMIISCRNRHPNPPPISIIISWYCRVSNRNGNHHYRHCNHRPIVRVTVFNSKEASQCQI